MHGKKMKFKPECLNRTRKSLIGIFQSLTISETVENSLLTYHALLSQIEKKNLDFSLSNGLNI